jgi:hypothetical protein
MATTRRHHLMKRQTLIATLISVPLLLAIVTCTSRYRLNLFLVRGEETSKVKVEKTEYVMEGVLNTPLAQEKIVKGPGNCIVLITGTRGETVRTDVSTLVGYDTYLRYKVFLQLPSRPDKATLPLENSSFVQLLGQYDIPLEEKMYLAREGSLVVDSISDKHLFGTIDGNYENNLGEPISFRGRFRVKISR